MKANSFSVWMLLPWLCSYTGTIWPDETPVNLPKQYAEVVLNVEGMT